MISDFLYQNKLFAGMEKSEADHFLSNSKHVTIPNGEYVFRQGEIGDSMYILIKGELEIILEDFNKKGKEKILCTLAPGSFFGEICVLQAQERTASVKAVKDSELVQLERSVFKYQIEHRDPGAFCLSYNIASILGQRLTRANQLIAELMQKNISVPDEKNTYREIAFLKNKLMMEPF